MYVFQFFFIRHDPFKAQCVCCITVALLQAASGRPRHAYIFPRGMSIFRALHGTFTVVIYREKYGGKEKIPYTVVSQFTVYRYLPYDFGVAR